MVNLYLHAHKILISNLPVKSCHLTLIHKQGSRVGKVLENHRSAVIAGGMPLSIYPPILSIYREQTVFKMVDAGQKL